MENCICFLYIAVLIILFYFVWNKSVEHFQISTSDNKDLAVYPGSHKADHSKLNDKLKNKNLNKNPLYSNDMYSLKNLSQINPTHNPGNNNSMTLLNTYSKDEPNFMKMVMDLDVNYTDPNTEVNEKCSPPGLCDVEKIKNKFSCGCVNNFKERKCTDVDFHEKNPVDNVKNTNEDIVEGFENNSSSGVFYTDYGGGEKYIPCGECQDGYIKNVFGKCEKKCHNCKTFITDHPDMLQKINDDKDNQFRGCPDCDCCGDCNGCTNGCSCKGDTRIQNSCDNCMRCKSCNKCGTKKKSNYYSLDGLMSNIF